MRRRLGLYFVPDYEARPGVVRAVTLDPRLEQWLGPKVQRSATEVTLALDPASARHLLDEINRRTGELAATGLAAVVVVSSEIRLPLKRFLEASCPRLVVLAFQELPAAVEIENAGIVTAPAQLARPESHLKAAA